MTTIAIDKIRVVYNARTDTSDISEMMGSIKQQGLIEPIRVWKDPDDKERYILDVGNLRLNALTKLGWATLEVGKDVLVNDFPYQREVHLQRIIVENFQRKRVSYHETARIVAHLHKQEKMSPEEIAKRLEMKPSSVEALLRHWERAPDWFKTRTGIGPDARSTGKLPPTVAAAILSANNLTPEQKEKVGKLALEKSLPVPEVNTILALMYDGASFEEASKIGQLYQTKSVNLTVKKTVYEDFKRNHPDLNFSALVMEGIWGRVPFPPGLFYDPKRARTIK